MKPFLSDIALLYCCDIKNNNIKKTKVLNQKFLINKKKWVNLFLTQLECSLNLFIFFLNFFILKKNKKKKIEKD